MAGKPGLGWAGKGTLAFVGVLGLHGCLVNPPCGCSETFEEVVMQVQDENGPVDSARISVYRADNGAPIDTAMWDGGHAGRGTYMVFQDRYNHLFPAGASSLEIRVVARKGSKSGEEWITVGVNADHFNLRKVAGADTITIR